MRADGSRVVNLTHDPASDRSPAWSPDGTRIVFASDCGGTLQLYAMGSDGRGVSALTDRPAIASIPDWQRFPGHGERPPSCRHP